MSVKSSGQSAKGQSRDSNEDRYLLEDALGLYIVADGAGAGPEGETAAAAAIQGAGTFVQEQEGRLAALRGQDDELQGLRDLAREAVEHAAAKVNELSSQEPLAAASLTLLLVRGPHVAVAHVGDGRLYLRREEKLHQLTEDHTIPAELARQGVIPWKNVSSHPFARVLTRYLGAQESVLVETLTFTALNKDRLLLCTNGIAAIAGDKKRFGQALSQAPLSDLTNQLIEAGVQEGVADDCTVIALEFNLEGDGEELLVQLDAHVKIPHKVLASISLFEDLSFARRARLLSHSKITAYEEGDVLVEEGELCSRLFVVLSGQLKLSAAGYDLRRIEAGGCLGESFLLEARQARATLSALESAQVLELENAQLIDLCARRPRLGNAVLKNLGRRLARRVNELSGEEKDHEIDL